MAKTTSGRYLRARQGFVEAGRDTAQRVKFLICGTRLQDGSACTARGYYTETFRGTAYHFKGTCDAGHLTERYGYAEAPVVDP